MIPQNGWDLLGHLGSALKIGESDPVKVHQLTYEIAEQTLTPEVYDELVNASEVRRAWADDSRSFNQLLPFYQPRVLLTHLTYLAYKAGFNPILAMRLLSSIAAAIGLCFFYFLLRDRLHGYAILFIPAAVLLGGVLDVARFEGADALSFCFFAMAVYFINKRHWLGLLLIALLPITRSDMIVMVLILAPYCFIVYKNARIAVVLSAVVGFVLYMLCNGIYGNYGWQKQFYVVHVQYLAYPADVETVVTPELYLQGLFRGSKKIIYNNPFMFFVLGFGVVCAYLFNRYKRQGMEALNHNVVAWLAFLGGLFVFAHYIIFPSMNVRYFAGQYILVALMAMCIVQSSVASSEDCLDD